MPPTSPIARARDSSPLRQHTNNPDEPDSSASLRSLPMSSPDAMRALLADGAGLGSAKMSNMNNNLKSLGVGVSSMASSKGGTASVFTLSSARQEQEETVPIFAAPLILNPYAVPRLGWDVYMALLLLYTAFMVPFQLAFGVDSCSGGSSNQAELVITWIVDISFWLDILLNFRTAIPGEQQEQQGSDVAPKTSDLEIRGPVIARRYAFGWFILDVVGAIPVHLIENAMADGVNGTCNLAALRAMRLNRLARLVRLLKLLRLLKMARFNTILVKIKDTLQINPGHVQLFYFVIMVFFVSHFLACILFWLQDWEDFLVTWSHGRPINIPRVGVRMLSCPLPVFDDDGNISQDSHTRLIETPAGESVEVCMSDTGQYHQRASPDIQYLVSLYVLMQTITTVGYGDFPATTSSEMIYMIVVIILGASGFGVVVGSMSSLLGRLDLRAAEFKNNMVEVEDFMHKEAIPLDMRIRVRDYCSYAFHNSHEIPSSIETLSMGLRCEVALYLYQDLVAGVDFFANTSKEFLTDIIMKLKAVTLAPNDHLYVKGEYGDSMYFLVNGTVNVEVEGVQGDEGDQISILQLSEGCYLGESCLMGTSEHRPLTVTASTWCNLFCLTQASFVEVIYQHVGEVSHMHEQQHAAQGGAESSNTRRGSDIIEQSMDSGNAGDANLNSQGIQPPIVAKTLASIHGKVAKGEAMDDAESILRELAKNKVDVGGREALVEEREFGGGGKARRGMEIDEDEMLANPDLIKADYDLMRVQLNNNLVRMDGQLKAIFRG